MPDWKAMKAEYIRGETSYRKLAEKYGVSFSTLRKVAAKEKWTDLRNRARAKADTKIVNDVSKQSARVNIKINHTTEKLLDRIYVLICDPSVTLGAKALADLSVAIKNVRDMSGKKADLDFEEQNARIDKLRKEAMTEEKNTDIRVILEGDLKEYAQ